MEPSKQFALRLLKWHREKNTRQMPWKGEKDPYKIWLSEIILQQTRVEQGWDYYNRFIKTFPTIHQLAAASDEPVYKLWEGLGYYSRCRNLLATARLISTERKGQFPSRYEDILILKGVGPYTAAAIASFAYNLPHAVVDGNVFRVLARVFGITLSSDSTEGKKYFTQLANQLLDQRSPGEYNQAIMDFGAVVCKPAAPLCTGCPFQRTCKAYQLNKVEEWPVRTKKTTVKDRWFDYLVIGNRGRFLLRKRTGKDIWANLYEFPLVEGNRLSPKAVLKKAEGQGLLTPGEYKVVSVSPWHEQLLSHQKIHARFFEIEPGPTTKMPDGFVWVSRKKIAELAFPRLIAKYWTHRR